MNFSAPALKTEYALINSKPSLRLGVSAVNNGSLKALMAGNTFGPRPNVTYLRSLPTKLYQLLS